MARKDIGQLVLGFLLLAFLGGCVQQPDRKNSNNNGGGTPTTPTTTTDDTLPTSVTSTREQSVNGFDRRSATDVLNETVVRGTLDDGDQVL